MINSESQLIYSGRIAEIMTSRIFCEHIPGLAWILLTPALNCWCASSKRTLLPDECSENHCVWATWSWDQPSCLTRYIYYRCWLIQPITSSEFEQAAELKMFDASLMKTKWLSWFRAIRYNNRNKDSSRLGIERSHHYPASRFLSRRAFWQASCNQFQGSITSLANTDRTMRQVNCGTMISNQGVWIWTTNVTI